MTLATYLGVVEEGRLRLCDKVALLENTQVFVVVPDQAPARLPTPRLLDPKQASLFVKEVVEAKPNADL